MRKFKRVTVIGLEFYVDYLDDKGEIVSIKEVHSGKRMICDGILVNGKELENLFRRSIGLEEKVKEETVDNTDENSTTTSEKAEDDVKKEKKSKKTKKSKKSK